MLVKKVFFSELVSNASKIFTVLVFILPVTELFKLLDQAASGNIATVTLVTMMIYGTIASFPMILTIACFLSIVITINRYCKDQEFSVWLASGVSPFYWLRQVSIFSIPMVIICIASTLYITPWATSKSEEYANFLTKQQAAMAIAPGLFKEGDGGRQVFYIEHYTLSPSLANRIFIRYQEQAKLYTLTANTGKIENNEGMYSISLQDGSRYDISTTPTDDTTTVINFKELKATIEQQYAPLQRHGLHINTAKFDQLWADNSAKAKAALSWRISIALMLFVMCIVAVPISIQVGRRQNNLVFITTPVIYAIYENLILTVNGYISNGTLPSMGYIFIIHGVLLVFALYLTYVKTYPQGYFRSKNKK